MDVLPFIDGRISYLNKIALYEREKPYISSVPFLLTEGKNANIDETKHDVKIFDVRGNEDDFKLPVHGFQYIKHQFSSKPDGKIDGPNHPYLEEVREILKAILQPKLVIFYDCNVRRIGDLDFFQPATSAHIGSSEISFECPSLTLIDHTPRNALFRFQEALQPYGKVEFDRWQAYTIWCPLRHPVTDWPLAVCDCRTVNATDDLESVDTVLPHRVNEIYHLCKNEQHKWYYMSEQQPDEALIMKIYDSDNAESQFCPHASFQARTASRGRERESIDVRAFVIY